MAKSKLFTPASYADCAPKDARETAETFVNPPTHPEYPVFDGPAGPGVPRQLRLGGSGAAETSFVQKRGFRSCNFIDELENK